MNSKVGSQNLLCHKRNASGEKCKPLSANRGHSLATGQALNNDG